MITRTGWMMKGPDAAAGAADAGPRPTFFPSAMMDTETPRPLRFTREGDLLTAELGERLGMENRQLLKTAVTEALDGGATRIRIRFSSAYIPTFVESSGWGALVWLTRQARERGASLALCNVDGGNLGYLRLIQLDEFFQVEDEAERHPALTHRC